MKNFTIKALLAQYTELGWRYSIWRSTKSGTPANGGKAGTAPARVGMVEQVAGEAVICSHGFHATNQPWNWKGERWWIVALKEPVIEQEDKLCSTQRKIVADLGICPWT